MDLYKGDVVIERNKKYKKAGEDFAEDQFRRYNLEDVISGKKSFDKQINPFSRRSVSQHSIHFHGTLISSDVSDNHLYTHVHDNLQGANES